MNTTSLLHDLTPFPAVRSAEALERLRSQGIHTFTCPVDRERFRDAAARLMRLYDHPDSAPDMLTELYATGAPRLSGGAGFTSDELGPHTERSGVPRPPHLLMLLCTKVAEQGGDTLLVDASRLFADLDSVAPAALDALTQNGAAFFGAANGHASPVLERTDGGRWSVRLRFDELARFSPLLRRHLPEVNDALDRNTHVLRLREGEGVLLDNTRWLHGRRRYVGERRMLRALGDPHPHSQLARGFYASWAHPFRHRSQTDQHASLPEFSHKTGEPRD